MHSYMSVPTERLFCHIEDFNFLPGDCFVGIKHRSIDPDVRQSQTLSNFKYAIKSRNGIYRVPKHFLIGDRKTNILLTRLRNGCNTLKADLYRVNLITSPICQCGHENEDAFHYLFQCNLYTNQRLRLFHSLLSYVPLTVELLLFGDLKVACTSGQFFEKIIKRYPIFSLQINYYQIDQKHK